jgi:hypothetical protein
MLKLKLYGICLHKEVREFITNVKGSVHEMSIVGFNEEHVRQLAQDASGPEIKHVKKFFKTDKPWLNNKLSTVYPIDASSTLGSILSQEIF